MAAKRRSKPLSYFGSRTDVGCVREHNEDNLIVAPPLFAVCDGMGGHAAGEVASEIATTVLANKAPKTLDAEGLSDAVKAANQEILSAAAEGRGREGMGTTLTAAMLEGERLLVAQVGDSRAYLLHDGMLQQITRDHSLVADMVEAGQITAEEARVHPSRSIITRALGTAPNTYPDIYELNVTEGDRLMLCSDGLCGMIENKAIEEVMLHVEDPQRCASMLVNEAIEAGGLDNVTVVVVNIEGAAAKRRKKVALKTKLTVAFILVLLVAIIGGAFGGVNWYASSNHYLGVDQDGYVAIFKGTPESFLWTDTHEEVQRASFTLAEMKQAKPLESRANEVEKGYTDGLFMSRDSAQKLLDTWDEQIHGTKSTTSDNGTNIGDTTDKPSDEANGEQAQNTNQTSNAANTAINASEAMKVTTSATSGNTSSGAGAQ